MQGFLKGLEDNITCLSTQIHELEAEYEKERHNRDKICEQLAHVERRWFLVTAIMEETKRLQELAEYPSWFYDYVNMHSKRMQYVVYTTCNSAAYQPDDNSTIGRGRCRYIFQNVSLTIKSRHLSWRRYMLLLGRTCRRSAHVQAVDQTTSKTRELKPPEVCLIQYLQF
ncbi:hypothetical protein BHE74_00020007 [Ensete ventricosum]|nr:hypothetical protein BHE74_00020007 [Ensete ventricosum]